MITTGNHHWELQYGVYHNLITTVKCYGFSHEILLSDIRINILRHEEYGCLFVENIFKEFNILIQISLLSVMTKPSIYVLLAI